MTREEMLKNVKPIIFNTENVKAILEGRKTVTRRVLKPRLKDDEFGCHIWFNRELNRHIVEKYDEDESDFTPTRYVNQPYEVGDILYVRETWSDYDRMYYKATDEYASEPIENGDAHWFKWKPSIHMPKSAARIFLKVTGVRVERLQEMYEEDAKKEGCISTAVLTPEGDDYYGLYALDSFSNLWNSTIKKQDLDEYGWEADPYVWVIEFERVKVD